METTKRIFVLRNLIMMCFMVMLFSSEAFCQVRKMSTKELTQESTAILVGKCIKKESFWNEKRDKIFTQVKIRSDEYIKGNIGSTAVITIPGGRVGNIIYDVSEMPIFSEGEGVFAFVWQHPSGKNLVTGAVQGKLTVIEDKKTGKKKLRGGPLKYEEGKKLDIRTTKPTSATAKVFLKDFTKEVKSYISK